MNYVLNKDPKNIPTNNAKVTIRNEADRASIANALAAPAADLKKHIPELLKGDRSGIYLIMLPAK